VQRIGLDSPLTIRNALLYPIQNPASRREILIGGLWLLVPGVGWLMNMGHRIVMTHNALHGKEPWPAWGAKGIFRHGVMTFLGMVFYHLPATVVGLLAEALGSTVLLVIAAALWLLGSCIVPGYMTRYCVAFDAGEIFDVRRSVRAVVEAMPGYWRAWGIVIVLLACSFVGLLGLGVAFLFTSVWFWQSAAFCFANVMVRQWMDSGAAVAMQRIQRP
jgi:hypothetical protein